MDASPLLITLFLSYVPISQSERILAIFQFPGNSPFTCNNAILKSLANAGHEITVVTAFPEKAARENYTSVIDASKNEFIYVSQSAAEDFSTMTFRDWMTFFRIINIPQNEKVLNLKEIKNIVNSKEKLFDAIFVDISMYERCYYWIATKLKIPIIGIITWRSWHFGDLQVSNPRHPLLPHELSKYANHEHFYDRIQKTLLYFEALSLYYWFYYVENDLNQFYKKYVAGHISFEEFMESKPSLIFVNSHSSYFPRPLNPNVIEIGGITTMTKIQPLPKDVELFLDDAKQGAILFTFGSIVRAAKIPKDKVQAFIEAFAEIPQRVIWKYEEPIEGLPNNIMIMDWVPQLGILAHKNVKAFISHCGQGAIHESIHHGVPLISCPLFADQHNNANIFENLQIAIHLDYETISKESVLQALNEVINNTKYYENMQKLSKSFKDRPMTPQQSVVYWTEYVIRHNGAPQSPITELNWIRYLLLDVICFISLVLFTMLYSIYLTCKKIGFYIALFRNRTKCKND